MATTIGTEAVLEALRRVEAPGVTAAANDVVGLGYVKDLAVGPEGVSLRLEYPAPLTPARRASAAQAREAVRALVGPDAKVDVALEGRIPTGFVPTAEAMGPRPQEPLAPGVKNFIAVGSGKGGVGKSTIAVNLALGLARAGARVGILDADIFGPSVPLLLGVTRQAYMEDMALRHQAGEGMGPDGQPRLLPYRTHGLLVMSLGFVVEPDKAAIFRGPRVHHALVQLLGDVEWGELDYLVFDLPPGTGDIHLSLAQLVPIAGAVVVCTPQPLALADAIKAIDLFRATKTEVLGLVENMSGHTCGQCGHHEDVFGTGGVRDAAFEWKMPFLGAVPLDARVRRSGDRGRPVLAGPADAEPPSDGAALPIGEADARADAGEQALTDALWGIVDRVTAVLAEKVRARPRSLPIRRT